MTRSFGMSPTDLSASDSTIFEYISTPSFHSYFPSSMSFPILSRQWIALSLSQADMAPYTNAKFPVRKKECTKEDWPIQYTHWHMGKDRSNTAQI
jgi:hypothetical protein